jgi:two-component system response regulator HydG
MPLSVQAKLLHVLESGTVRPLGATRERAVDVRIVAATHRNPMQAIQDGSFRKDLLYRLDVISIAVPALRDHREDIPELLEHFLEEARGRYPQAVVRGFAPDALSQLRRYAWPGNVRELAHTVEKVALLGRTAQVALADLPDPVNGAPAVEAFDFHGEIRPLRELERQYAAWALTQTGGHRGKTAEKLGVDPKTLRKWLDGPDHEDG